MRGTEYQIDYTFTIAGVDGCDLEALQEVIAQTCGYVLDQFPDVTCDLSVGEKEKLE